MALLSAAGLVEGSITQVPEVHQMLIVLVIVLPILFGIAQLILFIFYRLDKQYPKMMEELLAREASCNSLK